MDLLTDNALLNMPGPQFLLFYGLVAAIVILAFNAIVRLGGTNGRLLPQVPTRPDPYEIAYLRGGAGAVIGIAVYALKRGETIEMSSNGDLRKVPGLAEPINPVEGCVFREIGAASSVSALLGSRSLRTEILDLCEVFKQRLAKQDLVMTDEARGWALVFAIVAILALVVLAALKIEVAEMHGHNNVGFLICEGVVAFVLMIWSVKSVWTSVANRRGREWLDRVKTAYAGRIDSTTSALPGDSVAAAAMLAAVAALGFVALHGTADEAFAREFARSSGSSGSGGDGGGSCGGGGGGGGCGGCGGGGD